METITIEGKLAERVLDDFNKILDQGLADNFSEEDLYHGHAVYEKPTALEGYCLSRDGIKQLINDPSNLSILYHARERQTDHPRYSKSNILSTPSELRVINGGSKGRVFPKDIGMWSPFQVDVIEDIEGPYELQGKKKTYRLTKRGELARQVLDNLIEPKTLPDLVKLLRVHRNIVSSITKHLIQNGFITFFKTIKPFFCRIST